MSIKDLVQRITEELPGLDPSKTKNYTPGRVYKASLKDTDGNVIDIIDLNHTNFNEWVGFNYAGTIVASVSDATDYTEYRREDRQEKFADTIDRLNEIWFNELTTDQQLRIKAFRKAWLDWPTSTETSFPSTYDVDETNTNISTDVSDIFEE